MNEEMLKDRSMISEQGRPVVAPRKSAGAMIPPAAAAGRSSRRWAKQLGARGRADEKWSAGKFVRQRLV